MRTLASRLLPFAGVLASALVTAPVRADEPSPVMAAVTTSAKPTDADDPRIAYMDSVLHYYEGESSRYRTWNALVGLARGAASIPVGGFVLSREFITPGIVLVLNGGVATASSLLDLVVYKQPFEELRESFLARRRAGIAAQENLDQTEREWVSKANAVRKARIRSGALTTGVGVLLLGIGAGVGFRGLTLTSENAAFRDDATLASLLMGFGGMNLSSGVRSLLVADPIENGWQSYARARSFWSDLRVHPVVLSSGAYIGITTTL